MKKLIILLVLTIIPLLANADESGTLGNLKWTYVEQNKTLTISGIGEMVAYRPWHSYSFKEKVQKVVVEEGISSLCLQAFADFTSLSTVSLPNSLISIGASAFYSCSNLTDIIIPSGVNTIGANAFALCSSLSSIIIPNSVTTIGAGAFRWCYDLSSLTLGNGITKIEENTFRNCTSLTSITIPSNITTLGEYAFQNCTSLTSVDGCENVSSIADRTFEACSKLSSINLGKKLSFIGYCAFNGCKDLSSINIPSSLTTINYGAFLSSGLVSVVIPSNVITIEDAAFSSCPNLTLVSISNTVTNISGNAFDWCPNLSSITVDNGNPIFDSRNNCNAIIETNTNKLILGCKETIIPNSVVSLGNTSFRGSGLTSIDIPENVTSIGGGTFQSCSSLSSITLPNALQKIEAYAFADCIALANIICYADVVPTAASNSFAGVQASAILHVPKASIELYKLKEPWKSFSIVGIRNPEYILTYFVNNEEYKKYSIEEGEKIVPEPAPMKEGYTFSGWNEIPETMPAKDIEVTGTFTINKYKLTYMVDGEEYKTYEVEYESSITPEDEPTKEGYTFSGWSEIPETMPAEDIEIKGTFEVNTYKLTYWVDGEEYQSYEIEYGTEITPEEEPIKQGYTFSGWSEIPETMSAEDIEITGTFEINTYKLTYMVDDEEYQSYEIEYGAEITPEDEPTKEGYTFSGWSEIPETMPSEDVTITGTFTKGSFKIIYLVDGEVYKTIGYDYGDTISPEDEPTKDGYTFSGWSDIPETMPAEDIEVTGTFEINTYKLTYMVDGEEYKSYEIKYGADITAEEEPTKEGYTFSGWSEIPSTMPADDITITGTFTINQYKLTYEVDGEEYKVLEIEYAATITPEVEPTKEGYTFSGWSEIPKTMPAEDVTVTGTFTVNSYKLTYMIGNDIYKVVVYEYGATIIPESQPEGDYANFEWVGLPETMPAKDVTVYANYETGIMGVEMLQDIQAIYTPNGKKLDKPQKDLNIIRTKDGKVSKVVIK